MTEDFASQIHQIRIPKVVIDNSFCNERMDCVIIDNYYAVATALNHLVDLGHRKICFVGNASYLINFKEREEAFFYAFSHHPKLQGSLPMTLLAPGRNMMDYAGEMVDAISSLPQMPTAFLCANDWLATGCIQVLASMGYSIPKDMSVVGIDNMSVSEMFSPPHYDRGHSEGKNRNHGSQPAN